MLRMRIGDERAVGADARDGGKVQAATFKFPKQCSLHLMPGDGVREPQAIAESSVPAERQLWDGCRQLWLTLRRLWPYSAKLRDSRNPLRPEWIQGSNRVSFHLKNSPSR